MSESIDTKKIARAKVQKALNLIEQAQNILSLACQELSPIVGAIKQWEAVGKHYDKTNALWHKVNESVPRSKIDLDSDNKRSLIEQARKQP